MAIRRQVTCIKKPNRTVPYGEITHIGGSAWRETQPDAIRQIEAGTHTYFVKVGSKEVEVIVSSRRGDKYLTTEPDSTPENNLLSLPECP